MLQRVSQLARIHVFEDLPPEALLRLERGATTMEPQNGAEIFAQDDAADSLFAIVGGEGLVRAGAIDRRSKRLMVEVFALGDIFSEIGVIDGGKRTAAAVVDGRVRLMRIGTASFMAVLSDTPLLGIAIARMLSQRLRRTFDLFQDATFETIEVRLVSRLPSFSHRSESIGEQRDFGEPRGEALDQRQQPLVWHCWDQVVEHAALTEQRMGASFGRIRLQQAIVAEGLAGGPQPRQ